MIIDHNYTRMDGRLGEAVDRHERRGLPVSTDVCFCPSAAVIGV
jgi:hypothetical protein